MVLPSESEGSSFDADLMAYSRYVYIDTTKDRRHARGRVSSLRLCVLGCGQSVCLCVCLCRCCCVLIPLPPSLSGSQAHELCVSLRHSMTTQGARLVEHSPHPHAHSPHKDKDKDTHKTKGGAHKQKHKHQSH